jgi:hypothetical protein
MRQVTLKGYDMTDYVYIVTATTERGTFKWVYSNEWTAQKLVDLGIDHGGDVHWEQYMYDMDTPPTEALADFIAWTDPHEGTCAANDGFGCRCGEGEGA